MSGKRNQPRRERRADRTQSRREQRVVAERQAKRKRMLYTIGGAVVLAVVIVGGLILLNRGGDEEAGAAANLPVAPAETRDPGIPTDGRTIGDPNAPVEVIEYADYQCPACAQFATVVEPEFTADYIATGKVKYTYKDFPFLDDRAKGDESDDAAEAAMCAADQDKFWAFHDAVFVNHSGENEGAYSRGRLIEIARVAGLDVDQFTSCFDGDEHEDEVEAMYDEAIDRGVNSTPTFFVNGTKVTGAGYQPLRDAIEAALANS